MVFTWQKSVPSPYLKDFAGLPVTKSSASQKPLSNNLIITWHGLQPQAPKAFVTGMEGDKGRANTEVSRRRGVKAREKGGMGRNKAPLLFIIFIWKIGETNPTSLLCKIFKISRRILPQEAHMAKVAQGSPGKSRWQIVVKLSHRFCHGLCGLPVTKVITWMMIA